MWINDIFATQILREINFAHFEGQKSGVLELLTFQV